MESPYKTWKPNMCECECECECVCYDSVTLKIYAESNNICLKPLRLFTCTLTPSVLVPLLALTQKHQVNQKCFVFIGLLRRQADYQPDSSTCQRCIKILHWQSPMLPIMKESDSRWANDGPYTHPNTPLQALTAEHYNTYNALATVFIYTGLQTIMQIQQKS